MYFSQSNLIALFLIKVNAETRLYFVLEDMILRMIDNDIMTSKLVLDYKKGSVQNKKVNFIISIQNISTTEKWIDAVDGSALLFKSALLRRQLSDIYY